MRWPFQTALEFPDNLPDMPRMVSSRRPRGDVVFESKKMLRSVRCESKFEKAFFSNLDELPEVLWFHEQAPKLRYEMDGQEHGYTPDALVALSNGFVFVAEVKMCRDFALYETICKVNALIDWAESRGYGVFLGNASASVRDFVNTDVPRALRNAVVTACRSRSGMSTEKWEEIRDWSMGRYGSLPNCLQALAFNERLVMREEPFNVRRATPAEGKEIDLFVQRFETTAEVLPLSAARRPRSDAVGVAEEEHDTTA